MSRDTALYWIGGAALLFVVVRVVVVPLIVAILSDWEEKR
jgi:hypothetical protein